jgi:uncharacterized protein (DUF2252 family)
MASSPFAYFRGAAYPMASDLATGARTGLDVQLCGDAHLSNFGGFASPERDLVFDLNDFDETHPGPFEWDVKRLAASVEIAGRARELDDRLRQRVVLGSAAAYREAIRAFSQMRNVEVWYSHLDARGVAERWGPEAGTAVLANFERMVAKAQTRDHLRALAKLTREVDGELRFISDPPLIVPIEELFGHLDAEELEQSLHGALHSYRRTLANDRRHLLDTYRYGHLARKVVGVGSVGTRAWVALLLGRDEQDPLFIQIKEAEASVLERFSVKSAFTNHGQRVVEGQRLMQAFSDVFLGWDRVAGADGIERDYYMRQLWDWKVSVDVDAMLPQALTVYAKICGWILARAHARSGDAVAIGSYLGGSDTFERAIAEFAASYADQNAEDHRALVKAIAAGAVEAQAGV